MKNLLGIGVFLIVLGVVGLAIGQFSYTETKPVLKIGPMQVNSEEQHRVNIPTIAGVVVVLAGVALVFASRRSA
ncbi:MAG TPA: hypothetical protein VK759_06455 [Rhizomicrobium sp.]|jgi:hypothetical protein|nr:hypothetical protein [Rhizomicrobium sp.]